MINLRELAGQQRNQRALEIKNRNLKQTHDTNLEGSLSPITKNLEEFGKNTQQLGELVKNQMLKMVTLKHQP